MRGFGVTAMDFALECQMDKLAHLVGMDPMEFRILNAYRDGDMKAHRREAKNTALIECVQVAAEKAKWPLRDEFKRHVVAQGGGAAAAGQQMPADAARASRAPRRRRGRSPRSGPTYDRAGRLQRRCAPPAPPAAERPPPPPAVSSAARRTARTRFSSVFGTRRR